ncbi:hypothetical protein BEN74_03895 [Acinetobacter sp. WCHAc010034]|uniref:phage tail protein n=1 Tax=Acinetobacter sp. WCHAc010034 TaxID=1879049 RepID=UPI00083A3834|nr:phage tail protein [Acinetobacter sp. WCHAc010034]AYA02093.1 hypothetical protein BEN74_03895 [Acinetobacter sp. WCHAc010034]
MASQVTGYRYFSNFLLFIGNPIEKMLGINFDKRGWLSPFVDENGNALDTAAINSPSLYGENEGGVAGIVHVQYGTGDQEVLPFYKDYMESQDLPASAYPYQSYLAFTGTGGFNGGGWTGGVIGALMPYSNSAFYLGNSGYMKEMLLWPKRIHVRNDGRPQWYDEKSETLDGGLNACLHIDGSLYSSSLYMSEIGHNSPLYLISGPSTNFRWDGTDMRGALSFESRFEQASSKDESYKVRLQLNSAAGMPECIVSGRVVLSGTNIIKDDNSNGYWNIIADYYFTVMAGVKSENKVRFNISYAGEYETSDDKSDLYYESENIPFTSGLLCGPESSDLNPIHKIREILTDDTAMNKSESDVNDVNFMKAADRIYDEGLGISWAIAEKSCMDAINELCAHIEAGVRINRQTGLYEVVLFRDDWFAEDEIHALPQSRIKSLQLEVQNADEAVNQLNVSYYNREAIKDSSFSISENAAIKNLQGRVNAEEVKFPYFMNQRNAAVVAQWKLKQLSTPAWSGTFTTGFYEARKWNRYDIVKITWPQKNIADLPVRIMSIRLGSGSNNAVTIDFIEAVPYSRNLSSSVVIDAPIDTAPLPPQPALFKAFELSYFEAVQLNGQKAVDDALAYSPDAGYAAVIAQRPQNNSLNALMYTSAGGEYEKSGVIQYCETAVLDQNISRMSSSFAVKNTGNIGSVRAGSQITVNHEVMVYQSFDAATKILTVKRGALDTVPQSHISGAVLYFADDFVAVDPAEYAVSEVIDVKALTTTPSGVLSLETPGQKVQITGRAIRPYPPANIKLNNEYFPDRVIGDVQLAWAARNRMQQTGGDILSWFDDSVSLEPGTVFNIKLLNGTLPVIEISSFPGTLININADQLNGQQYKLIIEAVRDGYRSMQIFEHDFLHRMTEERISSPYDLSAFAVNQEISLSWKADEYTSSIDYFNIYRSTYPFDGSDAAYLELAQGVAGMAYTDSSAVRGTVYYYRVEAVIEARPGEAGLMLMSDEMVSAELPVLISAPYDITYTLSDL